MKEGEASRRGNVGSIRRLATEEKLSQPSTENNMTAVAVRPQ